MYFQEVNSLMENIVSVNFFKRERKIFFVVVHKTQLAP